MSRRSSLALAFTALAALAMALPAAAQTAPAAPGAEAAPDLEARRQGLRRKLIAFVIDEYLGTGRPDHANRADLYAERVDYYGAVRSRAAVMADKAAYYRKWPSRRYDVIESTLAPKPGRRDGVEFTFQYTFEVSDGRRTASGTGTATLEVVLREDDSVVIVKEAGRVLTMKRS
jgi:hypothetical protein